MAFEGATGFVGEVRVGGRLAGTLRDWSLKPAGHGTWTITAGLHDVNELFLNGGRPVEVRLALGKRFWRWTGCRLERSGAGATITAHGEWEQL